MSAEQEAFDKVWDWFIVQKKPKSTLRGMCRYRGVNSNKCGVGVLIPDDEYKPEFEGKSSAQVGFACESLKKYSLLFLHNIQNAHDSASDRDEIRTGLIEVAKDHNLTVPGAA